MPGAHAGAAGAGKGAGMLQRRMASMRSIFRVDKAQSLGLALLGLVRVFNFVRLVCPIILHYKWKQLLGKLSGRAIPDEEWDEMHKYYAPRALTIATWMQGFYIKIGQHLATTMHTIIPPAYRDVFGCLLEHCPSQSFQVVKAIVERELGPMDKNFESFVESPMNAASTGQVHCARLVGGHDVVVKVQHPDAEWTFGVDLHLFVISAELLLPQAAGVCKQIKRNLANEFDYAQEAKQQREALHHLEGFSNIVVPEPVDAKHPGSPSPNGLCTKRVLVMDRLVGMSLADWGRAQLQAQARLQGKTVRELQEEFMQKSATDMEVMRPSALGLGAYFVISRGADIACNFALFFYNWGLGYLLRRSVSYVSTPLPPNIHVITQDLMMAQGHMLFNRGFVNCDPHAGNVMLLQDGRLGLIDWGQVVRLTTTQRCIMAGLYIAVADKDDIMSADCMRALGGRTKYDWDWTQAMWAKLVTWSIHECEMNDFPRLSAAMDKVDMTMKEADSDFLMTFKNQLYTRQVAAMLGFFSLNSATILRDMAEKCLKEAGWPVPRTTPTEIPMPQPVRDLLSSPALHETLNGDSKDESRAEVQGWRRALPATLPPLLSYGVLCLLRCVEVSHTVKGVILVALSVLIAVGMGAYVQSHLRKRAASQKADAAKSAPCFCLDNRELALASM